MPTIVFESGKLADGVKAQLITKLTDVAADVTGIPKQLFHVSIRELPDDSIAIGGKSAADLKKEMMGPR
jgi:4-oxalocrotonate tautomerase